MISGGTKLILGHRVKGQEQILQKFDTLQGDARLCIALILIRFEALNIKEMVGCYTYMTWTTGHKIAILVINIDEYIYVGGNWEQKKVSNIIMCI